MSLSSPVSRSLAIRGHPELGENTVTCPADMRDSSTSSWTRSVMSTKSGTAEVVNVHST